MSALADRLARLERVFVEASIAQSAEGFVQRVKRIEHVCFGSEASGTLPQRIRELEIITFGEHSEAKPPLVNPDLPGAQADREPSACAAASHEVEEPEVSALPAAKRPRHQDPEQAFQLLGNAGPAASNPAAFKKFPLREEQLRSLAWMYAQEARSEGLRGGLLADKMGYGKTATTIGLLSEDRPSNSPSPRPWGYIKNPATLIMCPPHLVEQWEGEFIKFLGEEGMQLYRAAAPKGTGGRSRFSITITMSTDNFPLELVHGSYGKSWIVSELSEEMKRQNQRANPKKRVAAGDAVEYVRLESAQGMVREFSLDRFQGHAFADYLKTHCKAGCKVDLRIFRDRPSRARLELTKGTGPLKILAIADIMEMKRLRLECLQEDFHVVLASTRLLAADTHSTDLRQTLHMWRPEEDLAWSQSMAVKQRALHECVEQWHEKESFLEAALRTTPVMFETMWWRRVVLDEFHETESWKRAVREVLKSIGATHRWGLSGTPPLGDVNSVLEVAELLNYVQDESSPTMALAFKKGQSSKLKREDMQKKLHEECQAMISGFVRQNSSALVEAIAVREHTEFVEHTVEERLIYRQACHDHGVFDLEAGYGTASAEVRMQLLQRCAHFCLHTDAEDASAAVRLLGASKRARIQALRRQLDIEACRAALLSSWPDARAGGLQNVRHPEAAKFVGELLESTTGVIKDKDPNQQCLETKIELYDQHGELRLRPEVRLQQPVRDTEVYPRLSDRHTVLHAVVRARPSALSEEILSEMAICVQTCRGSNVAQNLTKALAGGLQTLGELLDAAHRSLDFYNWQMRGLHGAELAGYTCSICLCPADSLADLAMLPCSHVFHRSCILPALHQQHRCPECRQEASSRTMSSVLLEVQESERPDRAERAEPEAKELSPELRKHGSKLHAIASCLRKIRTEDATAKAIVFVQWEGLQNRVAEALRTHQLPVLQLPRRSGGRAMATVMQRFCTAADCFVLPLSLDNVASGTNLTAANHVFFVHPMNADTLSTAVAYEKQALARVRRVGQMRSEVHVWRFVTRHTVEEHIHSLHQRHQQAAGGA